MSHPYSPIRAANRHHTDTPVSSLEQNSLTPRQEKRAEYVFRVLHKRSTTTAASTEVGQAPTPTNIHQIRTFFDRYAVSSPSAPSQKEEESRPVSQKVGTSSLEEQNKMLRERVLALSEQNDRLKQQASSVQALIAEKAELEKEIERIKNEYVQTSLDAFQEMLRPQLQNISVLKAALDSQNTLRESLEDSLEQAHKKNLALAAQFKATILKLEGEMRGQQQRFQVQLSDRENQIHDLKRSLATSQHRFSSLENEIKTKDAFLLSLGQPRK